MKKSIIRIAVFMSILMLILGYVNKVFKVKDSDGIYSVAKFYELEDETVDVLIIGSSHAFIDFNTGTLWDEYGMAAYNLGGSNQPMWNTYYYLKEALKTQTPEIIVLEGYRIMYSEDYIDDSYIIKNNFGLKWSFDKINSIKVSSPKERWVEFMLEYEQYHTRYTELSSIDFLKNQGDRLYDDWKGFCCIMGTTQLEKVDVGGVTDRTALHTKTEEYYRKTIELALERNIPIIVVISPYAGIYEQEQQIYNSAEEIASEYGVEFINCNLMTDEIGLDYSVDVAEISHLNHRGSRKYSKFIGEYLKNNYTISDRRGDEAYESWQKDANYIRQMLENQELRETIDLDSIAAKIQDENYWVMISVDGNCNTSDTNLSDFLHQQGIYDEGANGIWLKQNGNIVWNSGTENAEKYIMLPAHDFCMKRAINENGQYSNNIIMDNIPYQKVTNGVNVLVYDTRTEKIADMFGINMDDNYNVIK